MFLSTRIHLAGRRLRSLGHSLGRDPSGRPALAPVARDRTETHAEPAFASKPAPVDPDAAIRAEVVAFLDRVEARELGRPERLGSAADRQPKRRDGQLDASATRGRSEAEQEAARLLEDARREASELICQARGEAEQMLEWSRAKAAEIVRRSQHVAADRFGQAPRPWLASEPTTK